MDSGGDGPPIVFLHGGGLDLHTWDAVVAELGDFRCLALDQRGHGQSDRAPGGAYTMGDYVADIAAFVAEQGLVRPLLVGQSMGGMNALGYVIEHDPDVAGLVVVDTAPRRRDTASADRFLAGVRRLSPGRYDPLVLDPERVRTQRAEAERLAAHLDGVRCPLLVVHGADSRVISAQDARGFAESVPQGELRVVEGAGHNVQRDKPQELAALIAAFTRRVSSWSAYDGPT